MTFGCLYVDTSYARLRMPLRTRVQHKVTTVAQRMCIGHVNTEAQTYNRYGVVHT